METREKRRIKLQVCTLSCSLITDEKEEYMQALANTVEQTMEQARSAAPLTTVSTAALLAALEFCDRAVKLEKECQRLRSSLEIAHKEAEIAADTARSANKRAQLLEAGLLQEEPRQAPKKEAKADKAAEKPEPPLEGQRSFFEASDRPAKARAAQPSPVQKPDDAPAEDVRPAFVNPLKQMPDGAGDYRTFFAKKDE